MHMPSVMQTIASLTADAVERLISVQVGDALMANDTHFTVIISNDTAWVLGEEALSLMVVAPALLAQLEAEQKLYYAQHATLPTPLRQRAFGIIPLPKVKSGQYPRALLEGLLPEKSLSAATLATLEPYL